MGKIDLTLVMTLCLNFLVLCQPVLSQNRTATKEESPEDVLYVEAPALFKCRVLLPEAYDAKKSYPLVVELHWRYADAEYGMSICRQLGLKGYIFAAPQGPYPEGKAGKYSWGKSDPETKGLWNRTKSTSEDYIAEVTRHLVKEYNVNSDEVYLMGHSCLPIAFIS